MGQAQRAKEEMMAFGTRGEHPLTDTLMHWAIRCGSVFVNAAVLILLMAQDQTKDNACREVFEETNLDAACEFVRRLISDMGGMILRKGQLVLYTKWYRRQRDEKDARLMFHEFWLLGVRYCVPVRFVFCGIRCKNRSGSIKKWAPM